MILGLLLVSGIGVGVIYSATQGGPTPEVYQRQIVWIVVGFVLMAVVLLVDYHLLVDHAELLYLITLGLLVYLLLFGSLRAGTTSPFSSVHDSFQRARTGTKKVSP